MMKRYATTSDLLRSIAHLSALSIEQQQLLPPGLLLPCLRRPPFFLRATARQIKCCLVRVIAAVLQHSSPGGHMRGGANFN